MSAGARESVLFSEAEIAARLREVAHDIAVLSVRPEIAVPVLAGAFVFASDLLRELARLGLDLPVEFVWLRSYGQAETPGAVTVLKPPSEIVRGRNILLIDGVLDTGATLLRARALLEAVGAVHVTSVVAVAKTHPKRTLEADCALFRAGNEFLYGYGMDRSGAGRGLPDIRVRRP
jgi:hypoxanthine phosphoribosyltransferase